MNRMISSIIFLLCANITFAQSTQKTDNGRWSEMAWAMGHWIRKTLDKTYVITSHISMRPYEEAVL